MVALWRYDKRDYYGSPLLRAKVRARDIGTGLESASQLQPQPGSPVVYHGMQLLNVESDASLLSAMVGYVTSVLQIQIEGRSLPTLALTPILTLTLTLTLGARRSRRDRRCDAHRSLPLAPALTPTLAPKPEPPNPSRVTLAA